MPIQVIMPQMGESVFEGTLTKWLKKVGDAVARDEALFEISTDKVDSEIPSPASGILSEILIPEGKTVQVNTVVAIIQESGEQSIAAAVLPQEHTAASVPMESSAAPPSIQLLSLRTSPLVRKMAREQNVDLAKVPGTGLEGRITKEDLLSYIERRSEEGAGVAEKAAAKPAEVADRMPAAASLPSTIQSAAATAPTIPEMHRFIGESETVPMTPMRKAIADHMVFSKRVSAHVNTVFEVDVSAIVRLREAHKTEFQNREGIPLTYTPFFGKGLVDTVREFPIVNSSVVDDAIVYKKPIHLGIAVALDFGLIVPVVRDAHLKSFTGLALSIHDLAERARTRRLKPDDVQNGTISLTNPGIYGSLFGTPIISQPQVAILGIGGITKRPVVISDAIAIRSMVYLSLTFDHRVIDGAVADKFMASLKERLQGWTQWVE